MTIPKKFRLLGMEWTVEYSDDVAKHAQILGLTNTKENRIFLDPALSPPIKDQTFLHELSHAIFDAMSIRKTLDFSHELEERIVELFANGLYAFIKDNPKCLSNSDHLSR